MKLTIDKLKHAICFAVLQAILAVCRRRNMILSDKKREFDITQMKGKAYAEMKDAHYHPYYEFYYLLSGTRRIFINDTIYSVKKGDLIVIPKGELHRTTYIGGDTHERIVMVFSDAFIEPLINNLGMEVFKKCFDKRQISIPPNRREYIEELFGKIIREHNGIDIYSDSMLTVYVYELILFVLRCHENAEAAYPADDIGDDVISEAAKFISGNFTQDFSLAQLSAKYNMSPSYFSRKFKLCTGFGYKEYLVTVRIIEACRLLLNTDLSITQIAEKCGFEDSNYFGDCFKKIKGMSPREYRKANGVV